LQQKKIFLLPCNYNTKTIPICLDNYLKGSSMTKFNEFDEKERQSNIQYVDECWAMLRNAREGSLTRATNYLFVLNTGGLLASLSYIASDKGVADIRCSIIFFSLGIFFSALHAGIDYYSIEYRFSKYIENVNKLYRKELDWEDFIDDIDINKYINLFLHFLGLGGAIAFFVALGLGLCKLY